MSRYPFSPYPTGWYAVAASADLQRGEVRGGTWLGQRRVLWRDGSGRAHLHGALCPHLGADLGRGGSVRGDTLACPFHDFRFDGNGACVHVPYTDSKPPARARLPVTPLREHDGLLLVWHDDHGRAPTFDVPPLPAADWSPWGFHTFRGLRSHPQETSENSVDLGHLQVVHGYGDLEVLTPLHTEGARLTARYGMRRETATLGLPGGSMKAAFTVHVHGLGFSLVDVDIPTFGMQTQQLVLCTPTDPEHVDLMIGMRWRHDALQRVPAALRGLLHRALLPRLVAAYRHDVAQDVDLWENKAWVHPPLLARGDGPIGAYRAWAAQFYPPRPGDAAA